MRDAVGVAEALAATGMLAPVKVMWSREDDMKAGHYRPLTVHRAEIGFDDAGRVLAWDHRIVRQRILAGAPFEPFMVQKGVDDKRQSRLVRVTAGVHCNLCVNPRTVEVQVQGSSSMALATTMEGHRITLKDGRRGAGNFHDMQPLRLPDAPPVAVFIVPSSDPPKGMGEPGLPPLAPALANAVARLTGVRHCKLPFKA